MSPQQPRIPDADIVLPNGAHLTLYRDVKLTMNKDGTKLVGDYLIALVPGEPRAVLYFYQRDGKRKVEMVYTDLPKAVTEEWDDVPPKKDDILPENLHWTLCSVDDPADVKRYTALYDAIKNHP